jgi:hypothetical protein
MLKIADIFLSVNLIFSPVCIFIYLLLLYAVKRLHGDEVPVPLDFLPAIQRYPRQFEAP